MKKIKIGLILIALLTSFIAQAQVKFKFGVGGGANLSSLSGDIPKASELLAYNLGIITEIKLPAKIGIEADILFSTKGAGDVTFFDGTNTPIGTSDLKLTYLDFPLVVKCYSLKVISFQAGIQYSFLLDEELLTVNGSARDFFYDNDFSVIAGIGVDVKRVHFSARYNFGVLDIDSNPSTVLRNNMFSLTLGVWLRKKK